MNPGTQREEELFDEARRLDDVSERQDFLERTCAGDPALRTRIENLLDAGSAADRKSVV